MITPADLKELAEGMPTPVELCNRLESTTFSADQAYMIASEVYQPLLNLITALAILRSE